MPRHLILARIGLILACILVGLWIGAYGWGS